MQQKALYYQASFFRLPSYCMSRLILLNKPYGVICQFTPSPPHECLADYISEQGVYPAGRLDTDSEGLLLLTDHGPLQARIADPAHKLPKTYWVQVEGEPDDAALEPLRHGVNLGDFTTQAARVRRISEPEGLWPRNPPVRFRASIPTSWLEIEISEGKNRQVRRMTAKVGFPTLRLIRARIGHFSLQSLQPGEYRVAAPDEYQMLLPRKNTVPKPQQGRPKQRGRRGPNKAR
jgi:23S rRNA pseudouridine2457 synthase